MLTEGSPRLKLAPWKFEEVRSHYFVTVNLVRADDDVTIL